MRIVLLFFSFVEQVEEVTFVADVAVVVCLLSVDYSTTGAVAQLLLGFLVASTWDAWHAQMIFLIICSWLSAFVCSWCLFLLDVATQRCVPFLCSMLFMDGDDVWRVLRVLLSPDFISLPLMQISALYVLREIFCFFWNFLRHQLIKISSQLTRGKW